MVWHVEVAWARSNLAALRGMLDEAVKDDDFLAELQLVDRVADQEEELRLLEARPYETGELSVFFGGAPMIRGTGLDMTFVATALDSLQHLIARKIVVDAGNSGQEGCEPPKLLLVQYIPNVSGFVLLESVLDDAPPTSRMKAAIERVTDLLAAAGAGSEPCGEPVSFVGSGVLRELETFIGVLSNAGASLKVVERTRRATLSVEDIHKARNHLARASAAAGHAGVDAAIHA